METVKKLLAVVAVAIVVNLAMGMDLLRAGAAPYKGTAMTGTGLVMPVPKMQFFNNSGAVLSAGKLYSYAAGTTTPQPTYTDSSLGTPNTNPVILDAYGRATVYLSPDTAYKFTLQTSTGSTLWTQDNVSLPPTVTPPAPDAVPTGAVLSYGAASAPTGYVLGDGSAIDRVVYADLFTVIGTTYGAGDGSTTFNVPDCRGRFPLYKSAAGTGSTLGATGGSLDHTHTYTDVVNHTHTVTITDPGHAHTQAAHSHTITITDPGHTHTQGQWTSNRTDLTTGGAADAVTSNVSGNTGSSTTGITASSSSQTPTINSNTTGITAATANPAGGVATGTTASNNPAFLVFTCIVKT